MPPKEIDAVDRKALGIKAKPHDLSWRYPGHEDRVAAHVERVRVHFAANPHEEGADSVLDLWGQPGRQASKPGDRLAKKQRNRKPGKSAGRTKRRRRAKC